jgi:hypothetical protein
MADATAACPFCGYARNTLLHVLTCEQGDPETLPTLADARARGAAGMASVEAHAERVADFDPQAAGVTLIEHLRAHGNTPGEQLVMACRAAGHRPHDDRAFGGVFQRLRRQGRIESVATIARRRGKGADGGHVYRLVW